MSRPYFMPTMLKSALLNGVITVVLSVTAGLAVWYQVVEKRLGDVESRLTYTERELRVLQISSIAQRDTIEAVARDVSFIRGRLEPR
jgi:hypothetical protein